MGVCLGSWVGEQGVRAWKKVSQHCVRSENEVAAFADQFWALFFLPSASAS